MLIWIPKTAGTSVWKTLDTWHCPALLEPFEVRTLFPQRGLITYGHQSYRELLQTGWVSEEFDRRAFKFCFVRNPFDRAVSLFSYLSKYGLLPERLSFYTFAHLVRDGAFDPIGLYNFRGLSQCNPQVRWITHPDGSRFVDFVGRHENIDADFKRVCAELGVSGELRQDNRIARAPYSEYYNVDSRRAIEQAYAEDLDAFSYRF